MVAPGSDLPSIYTASPIAAFNTEADSPKHATGNDNHIVSLKSNNTTFEAVRALADWVSIQLIEIYEDHVTRS